MVSKISDLVSLLQLSSYSYFCRHYICPWVLNNSPSAHCMAVHVKLSNCLIILDLHTMCLWPLIVVVQFHNLLYPGYSIN